MKSEYLSQGYTIIKNLFSEKEISGLLAETHQVFAEKFDTMGLPYTKDANGLIASDAFFRFFSEYKTDYIGCMKAIQNVLTVFQLGTDQRLREVLKDLGVITPAFSTKPIIMFHHEKVAANEAYWKTPPHQDWRSIQGSLNCVVVWLPLINIYPEIGPIEIIPESHHKGLLPAEEDNWYMHVNDEYLDESFVSVPVNAGDAVIFSAFLLHRSGTNKSNDIRSSLQFRFNDLTEETYIQRSYPDPYTYKPQKELITPDFPQLSDIRKVFGTKDAVD